MIIPLRDGNPLHRIPFQFVTVALIAACVLIFLWQLGAGGEGGEGEAILLSFGMIPAVVTGEAALAQVANDPASEVPMIVPLRSRAVPLLDQSRRGARGE